MFPYSFGALINDKFLFVQPNPIHSQTLFSRAFGLFLWKGRMNASELWGLNESTLRKAISYGKPVNGVDVCKFGKQWVVSMDSMQREYGARPDRE